MLIAAESRTRRPLGSPTRYSVRFARNETDLRAAQELRHAVFAEQFGAALDGRTSTIDADFYDRHCEHLIVRDELEDRVVGTYRLLSPEAAENVGSYCSEDDFYMTRLASLRPELVEVSRSCIAADHRHGAVIALLWLKLLEYMADRGYRWLIGCAPVPMRDGGHNAANVFMQLGETHLAPVEYRVMPRTRLPYERVANEQVADVPALIKGYLRAGAWICGEPAWSSRFNCAELPMLLPIANLSARYRKHLPRR